jgi:hypothetical protein
MHREAEHPSTHARKKFGSINMEMSINTKTRLQVMTWSLVFMLKLNLVPRAFLVVRHRWLKLISTFIGQNKELFFMHVLKKDVLLLCA